MVYHEQKILLESQRIEINKLLSFLKETIQELPIGIIQADEETSKVVYFNNWIKSRFKDDSILSHFIQGYEGILEPIQKHESKVYSLAKKVDVYILT
jgi:c-di-AMP phosphodiesterase-like protein